MRQHAALKAQTSEEGPTTRVLVLGDSITEELLGTRGGKTRPDWGSPAVWMRYYADLGSINLGVSGDQTQHLLWRLQNGELPDLLQPESILVAIGTNNLGKGMDAQDTVGGVKAVVKYVREQRPDALVSVMALFPRADPNDKKNPTPWPVIDEVNGLLEHLLRLKFGTKKVHFIDCNDRFLAEDRYGREVLNKEFILPDNLHLTGDGLDAWADCAEAAVHSGLGEGQLRQ
ncbi:lipolytic enzyme, G-D-S-L [Ectocarpus siliculosus]|uniref:Lipolytic enzyme, G-D-S-L n=1 Tax=Ectocarpus siliculosus TaxID=2880 RepID=D8LR16_ECTSI|nr:lipolytic enzyme, G-D-S-L [Ectocarpus siliculosus]|eukprot:CBN77689.1 lipolytic enzyme, G-D-S-L [Ectocarpus siliculosus]